MTTTHKLALALGLIASVAMWGEISTARDEPTASAPLAVDAAPSPNRLHATSTRSATSDPTASASTSAVAPATDVDFRLMMGSTVRGRVLDQDDRPLAGVNLSLEDHAAVSSEDGSFEILGIAPGRHTIWAKADGFRQQHDAAPLLGLGEDRSDIIVRMAAAPSLQVTFVDEHGDPACRDGKLHLGEWDHAPIDRNGVARFPGLLPGTYQPEFSCSLPARSTKLAPIVVEQDTELVRTISGGVSVTGCVEIPAGSETPEGLRLSLMGHGDWTRTGADERGCFSFAGVTPGTYKIEGDPFARAGAALESSEFQVADANVEVNPKLVPHASVDGVLKSSDGEALSGYRLHVEGRPNPFRSMTPSFAATETAAGGSFSLPALPEGAYDVSARDNSGAQIALQPAQITIAKNANVSLVAQVGTLTITGRVTDPDGGALTDVFVGISTGGSSHALSGRSILVDPDGTFAVDDLVDGDYVVQAFRRGGTQSQAVTVEAGNETQLTLGNPSALALSLHGPANLTGPFTVRMRGPGRVFERVDTPELLLEGLTPGEYEGKVIDGAGNSAKFTASVDPSEDREVTVNLAPAIVITGRVVNSQGEPIISAEINVGNTVVLPGKDGRFEANVPDISRTITVHGGFGSTYERLKKEIAGEPGQRIDLSDVVLMGK